MAGLATAGAAALWASPAVRSVDAAFFRGEDVVAAAEAPVAEHRHHAVGLDPVGVPFGRERPVGLLPRDREQREPLTGEPFLEPRGEMLAEDDLHEVVVGQSHPQRSRA